MPKHLKPIGIGDSVPSVDGKENLIGVPTSAGAYGSERVRKSNAETV